MLLDLKELSPHSLGYKKSVWRNGKPWVQMGDVCVECGFLDTIYFLSPTHSSLSLS